MRHSFILEGIFTFVCAVPAYWIIPDFPEDDRVLHGIDQKRWLHRLHVNQGVTNAPIPFSWRQVRRAFLDWKTYVYALMSVFYFWLPSLVASTWWLIVMAPVHRYIGIAQPFYSLALFTPTIIKELGYTNANANLLSVPPYALGFITTLLVGWLSDKTLKRGVFIIVCMIITIIGYAIQLANVSVGAKYCEFSFLRVNRPKVAASD